MGKILSAAEVLPCVTRKVPFRPLDQVVTLPGLSVVYADLPLGRLSAMPRLTPLFTSFLYSRGVMTDLGAFAEFGSFGHAICFWADYRVFAGRERCHESRIPLQPRYDDGSWNNRRSL